MEVRQIHVSEITEAVAHLCIQSNIYIDEKIKNALETAAQRDTTRLEKYVLDTLLENAEYAAQNELPLCQDTGMAVVFIDIGQDTHITGGNLTDAVNSGVEKGYERGYLRKSVVKDPIDRVNTGTSTPCVIHYDITDGDKIKITVAPKGFGSENMGAVGMFNPSDGISGVKQFIINTVRNAGSNPCPPIIVGVGVGGTMEKAAVLAKRALLRELGEPNVDPFWAETERELLNSINSLNIGAAGFGGLATALAVHINVFPTHIAGLPVAVNIGCHSTRHCSVII